MQTAKFYIIIIKDRSFVQLKSEKRTKFDFECNDLLLIKIIKVYYPIS